MSNCKTKKCGCLDTGLTTPTPCEHDTVLCPNPDPCPETFSDCCVVHDGDGIAELNIQTGDRVCDIWQKIALAISNVTGSTIESVTVVGNDLVITMTDGTIFTTPLPSAPVPNDDWVQVFQTDLTFRSFNGTPGTTFVGDINNDLIAQITYNVISPQSVLISGWIQFDILIDTTFPAYEEGTFTLQLRFPPMTSPSGWFVGNKGMSDGIIPINLKTPVYVNITPPVGEQYDAGAGSVSFSNNGAENRLILFSEPKILLDGIHTITLGFNASTKIVSI